MEKSSKQSEGLDMIELLLAFSMGLLGAAMGALPAFIIFGAVLLVCIIISISGGDPAFTSKIAFDIFGPHIFFAGGVAACAYAGKCKMIASRKDLITPLIKLKSVKVLIVGGIFGIIGYLFNALITYMKFKTDTIAVTVVVSAIIARYIFGNTGLFGTLDKITRKDAKITNLYGRLLTEKGKKSWLPWENNIWALLLLGSAVGLFSGWIALLTKNPFLGFSISIMALIFLETSYTAIVTHHMTLPAGLAAIATGSMAYAVIFGIAGALIGELMARLVYNWGDTHIDPPAGAIAITATILAIIMI